MDRRARLLRRTQRAAERGMVDTCTIRRVTGVTVDQETGADVLTYAEDYAEKCRFQQADVEPT